MQIISLKHLIGWVSVSDPGGSALNCNGQLGRELNRRIKSLCQGSIPSDPGVYAWTDCSQSSPSFIYVGMTGARKRGAAATLQWRLAEELRDERAFLWQTKPNSLSDDQVCATFLKFYPRSESHVLRSLRKRDTTHIIYTRTPELEPIQIRDLERWLISILRPKANHHRDEPRFHDLKYYAQEVVANWEKELSTVSGLS